MHPFLFIHACIHASKSHFTKQFVIQHSSPVVHSGSQTPENLFFVNHVHISRLFCMDLSANRSVPAFAIGLCLCCTVLIASSYFIVVQHLLGHKAPLLFLKDIWSSFVMFSWENQKHLPCQCYIRFVISRPRAMRDMHSCL